MARLARFLKSLALFTVLTVVMTWPQASRLGSAAHDHHDVYFNLWRFAWVAHALSTAPAHLFDGNIFAPESATLTFSDAMPVESFIAAPMLWAGLRPILVHNIMLLGGIILSAAGIWVLAAELTGSAAAGITAGVVFAFAPYRFEHYMHMELQWTVWMPWAFWAMHRALRPVAEPPEVPAEGGARASWKYGLLTGLFVALQFMSSIYYGIFLVTLLPVTAVLLLVGMRPARLKRSIGSLVLGAILAGIVVAPYAMLYLGTKSRVGGRSESETLYFSARPSSYKMATETNYLYGEGSAEYGRAERRLFPGLLPILLALVGLLLRRPSDEAIAYLVALALAFEMSLGLQGYSFTFLYHHAPIFDSLRAPARLGVFVLFFLSLLAAYGHAALEAVMPRRGRPVLALAVCAVLMLEYWVAPLPLTAYPNTAPPLYAWLARQPPGIVAEFPMPRVNTLPGDEARYAYMSTFHWMPLVNGYSGYYPPSYMNRIETLRRVPDRMALDRLRRDQVRYIIVHASSYPREVGSVLYSFVSEPRLVQLGHFHDGVGEALVFTFADSLPPR
jgi:hypothetical protein